MNLSTTIERGTYYNPKVMCNGEMKLLFKENFERLTVCDEFNKNYLKKHQI
jgi:hypothetical protein